MCVQEECRVSELVDRSERERAAQRNSGEPPASLVPRYEAQVAEAMQHKRAMHALLAHAGIAVDKYRCDKLSKSYHIVVQHVICTPPDMFSSPFLSIKSAHAA